MSEPIHNINFDDFLKQTYPGREISNHAKGPLMRGLRNKGCNFFKQNGITFISFADDMLEELTNPNVALNPKKENSIKRKHQTNISLDKEGVLKLVTDLYKAVENLLDERDQWKEAYNSIKEIKLPSPPEKVQAVLNAYVIHSGETREE
jgi:hypothetical protein